MKNIEETKDYFVEEINQNKLMSKTHKKVCPVINYIEQLLILASAITGCVSTTIGIASSAAELKVFAMNSGTKKHMSIISKMKKRDDKIILSAKTNLNSIKV